MKGKVSRKLQAKGLAFSFPWHHLQYFIVWQAIWTNDALHGNEPVPPGDSIQKTMADAPRNRRLWISTRAWLGSAWFGLVWFGCGSTRSTGGRGVASRLWANLLLSHNLWQLIGSRSEELHCESRASQLASQQLSKPAIVWAWLWLICKKATKELRIAPFPACHLSSSWKLEVGCWKLGVG